jgi:glycerophosphoryl diester phosphodiesterase
LEDTIKLVAYFNGYINIDIKNVNVICKASKLIEKYDYNDRTYFTGIGMKNIKKVFSKLPRINAFANLEGDSSNFVCETLICSKLGSIGINVERKYVDKKLIDYVKNLDIFSSCWDVDKIEDMKKMIEYGVDLITTRRPDLLYNLIN